MCPNIPFLKTRQVNKKNAVFPSRLAQPPQHATGLALKADLPHVFAEMTAPTGYASRSVSALTQLCSQSWTKHNGKQDTICPCPTCSDQACPNSKGHALCVGSVPKRRLLGGYQVPKIKTKHAQQMMYMCVHQLATVHTVLPLCDSPHHPPKTHKLSPSLPITPV